MRVLLDTHLFLWMATGSRRLRRDARRLIQGADAVYVSAASVWEIAVKVALGKLDVDLEKCVAAIEASGACVRLLD